MNGQLALLDPDLSPRARVWEGRKRPTSLGFQSPGVMVSADIAMTQMLLASGTGQQKPFALRATAPAERRCPERAAGCRQVMHMNPTNSHAGRGVVYHFESETRDTTPYRCQVSVPRQPLKRCFASRLGAGKRRCRVGSSGA